MYISWIGRLVSVIVLMVVFFSGRQDKTGDDGTRHGYKGYQMENLVKGISKNTHADSALIRFAGFTNPDILHLTIDAGFVFIPTVSQYKEEKGDSVALKGKSVPVSFAEYMQMEQFLNTSWKNKKEFPAYRYIYRNGEPYGWLVGKGGEYFWPVNEISGEPLDVKEATDPKNYKIHINTIDNQKLLIKPDSIYRISKPHVRARKGPVWEAKYGQRHELFIQLPQKIDLYSTLIVEIENVNLFPAKLTILNDYMGLRSEAIHVNQAGFHPCQRVKHGFLSQWKGDGGATIYNKIDSFYLIDVHTNNINFRGQVSLKSVKNEIEYVSPRFGPDNYNGTNIYEIDFSVFQDTGTYKIAIKGIGCSFPFKIDNKVWERLFQTQMKGFFSKRSGMEIGPPYIKYKRPLNHHPDVGFEFFVCNREEYFNDDIYSWSERNEWNPFTRIKKSINFDSIHTEAWGGWMDAVDYDRRNHHFMAVHRMLDLYSIDTSFFGSCNLNIPESENLIPDILDEALWCTELWRRTQANDGSVIFGIETIMHPLPGECSFMESIPYALVPGNTCDAYLFSAVAAHMANVLNGCNKKLSEKYSRSAFESYNWAQRNEKEYDQFLSVKELKLAKAWANFYLYLLTGDDHYLYDTEKYLVSLVNNNSLEKDMNGKEIFLICQYVRLNMFKNPASYEFLKSFVLHSADSLIQKANKISHGEFGLFDKSPWLNEIIGADIMITAHQITHETCYINALLRASQYGLGLNPQNAVFTSGIGKRHIIPWDDEAEYMGIKAPPGIPVYGPHLIQREDRLPQIAFLWCHKRVNEIDDYVYPSFMQWPVRETYFELVKLANINEFTIHQVMANQMYRWGYMAQFFNK